MFEYELLGDRFGFCVGKKFFRSLGCLWGDEWVLAVGSFRLLFF